MLASEVQNRKIKINVIPKQFVFISLYSSMQTNQQDMQKALNLYKS